MPGLPSLGRRKPGKIYSKLVIRKGLEGSNPSPGALFEGSRSIFITSEAVFIDGCRTWAIKFSRNA